MIKLKDVADEYAEAKSLEAKETLRRLIVGGLSPLQRKAYDLILAEAPHSVASSDIREGISKSPSHTANLLKSLNRLGLVIREYHTGTHGVYCSYRVNLLEIMGERE